MNDRRLTRLLWCLFTAVILICVTALVLNEQISQLSVHINIMSERVDVLNKRVNILSERLDNRSERTPQRENAVDNYRKSRN